MTTPPIRYADLLDYAKARPDLIKHVGENLFVSGGRDAGHRLCGSTGGDSADPAGRRVGPLTGRVEGEVSKFERPAATSADPENEITAQ